MKILSILALFVPFCLSQDTPESIYQGMVDWIVENGGTINPKQEYKSEGGKYGMFATDEIKEGEVLISVPWKCVLTAGTDDYNSALHCDTINYMVKEMKKEKSKYAPYIKYLLSLPTGFIPSSWTDAGKDLLEQLVATDMLPPNDIIAWLDSDWREDCEGSPDPFDENAAMILLSRGDDDRMVPLFDLYNHRNGKWFNTETNMVEGKRVELLSSRDIKKGEQLYNSYNMCSNCQNRAKNYGTPEILRDYGFVENFPQRWTFFSQGVRIDLDKDEETGEMKLTWRKNSEKQGKSFAFLRVQLKRLTSVVGPHIEAIMKQVEQGTTTSEELPTLHEVKTVKEYYDALTLAMKSAIEHAEDDADVKCPGGKEMEDGTCMVVVQDGYSSFKIDDYDDENYQHTCDNKRIMKFNDYDDLGTIQSVYQTLNFAVRPTDKNVCFDLDDTVQICSNYRPHYHEYATHLPARFMKTVKRAVFVGGGDSMLLHELRKYPDIELIVGLELDQTVVRTSLKHFKTQPHFDDERVQWWFGDATKSLLMLPKEYFGSFDLVLVDLSETVMSFTVTKDLDMLQALALLIKPDGVFVKNEQYFDKIGEMFDYSMQSYFPNVPIICDQAYSMGSNRIDFLHPNVDNIIQGHGVEMILLEEIDEPDDRFQHIQYYQKTNARKQGMCSDKADDSDIKLKRAGLLMILEAEDALGTLKGKKLEAAIKSAVEKEGLRAESTVSKASPSNKGEVVVTLMREGFVTARTWPQEKYCAFDIYLWGRFNDVDKVKTALTDAVGSKKESISAFRIVVGGMRGTDTWAEDKQVIGPKTLSHTRNCGEETGPKTTVSKIDQDMIDVALEESLTMSLDKDIVAAVFCGVADKPCKTLDVVSKNKNVAKVVTIYTCPSIEKAPYLDDSLTPMFTCEMDTANTLRSSAAKDGKFGAFVVDPEAPMDMVQILERIIRNDRNRRRIFAQHTGFYVPMLDMTEKWRRNFLEKSRSFILEPATSGRAEVQLKSSSDTMEMGVLTTNDPHFFVRILNVTDAIVSRTGLDADIPMIKGQPMKWQNWQPREYLPEDYDPKPAEEQFKNQKPLGHQTIVQMKIGERKDGKKDDFTADLKNALEASLTNLTNLDTEVYEDLGMGVVVVGLADDGSVTAVFDGKSRLTVDLFTFDGNGTAYFVDAFLKNLPRAKVLLRDEMPRGTGRVVIALKDL